MMMMVASCFRGALMVAADADVLLAPGQKGRA
jgi:hypothetical protein